MGFFDSQMDSDTVKYMTDTPFDTINLIFLYLSEQLVLKSKILKHIEKIKKGEFEDPNFQTNDKIAQFVNVSYFADKEKKERRMDFGIPLYRYEKIFNKIETIEWDFIKVNQTYVRKHSLVEAKVTRDNYTTIEIRPDPKFKFYESEVKEVIKEIETKLVNPEDGTPRFMCFSSGPELTILTKNAEEILKIAQRGFKIFVYGQVQTVLVSMPGCAEIFNLVGEFIKMKVKRAEGRLR
ncbi:MAG TPA: hypothetical protein ENN73_02945 [Firmicutes bacterium]|nr:hypothetical protein [Bacillota bacterium]